MAGGMPTRRSPRASSVEAPNGNNAVPSPVAQSPGKQAATPQRAEHKENAEPTPSSVRPRFIIAPDSMHPPTISRALDSTNDSHPRTIRILTPSIPVPPFVHAQILKRRRRSILSDVSKMASPGAGAMNAGAKKRRKQSMNRRVSFAVDTALESVREFMKDDGDENKAFPDPVRTAMAAKAEAEKSAAMNVGLNLKPTAVEVPPAPKPPASLANCPPPAPSLNGAAPSPKPPTAPAVSPAASMPSPSMAQTPTGNIVNSGNAIAAMTGGRVDPFAAFGVSDSPSAGSGGTSDAANTSSLTPGVFGASAEKSTPGSAIGGGNRSLVAPGTGQSDFTLDTPGPAESTGAPTPHAHTPQSLDLTKHLPRRVTMDPGQLFAGRPSTTNSPGAGLAALADEDEGDDAEKPPTTENFTFTSGLTSLEMGSVGITTEVPRLSDLAADDEEDGPSEPIDDFGTAGEHTMMLLQGLKENQHGGVVNGEVTAGVPSLTALADEDDLDASMAAGATRTVNITNVSAVSSDASPAVEGLPMGSVTEDVAAGLAAHLAAQVAKDQARHSDAAPDEEVEEAVAADATVAMDLGFTTVLPIGPFPTPTATVQFGGDGAPTPTATVAFSAGAPTPTNDSGFGFTRALEGGAHDAWGGQRKGAEAAAAAAAKTNTRKSMAPVPPGNRRMTMGIQGVQGIAHPADRRKSRAPFAMPNATQMLGEATMTVDLDGRGKNVMGTNTFDFVYGGNAFGSTPTVTAMFKKDDKDDKTNEGVTEKENEGVDLNLSDSFEIPPGAAAAAASVKTNGVSVRTSDTWDKPLTESDKTNPVTDSSGGFDTMGDDTMRMLLKMKDGEHGDAPQPLSDAATVATDSTVGTKISALPTAMADTWDKSSSIGEPEPVTAPVQFSVPTPGVEVAATPADAFSLDESSDGFTPGPETLEMMAKLKAKAHGNATVNFGSVGKNLWSQIKPSPLPQLGGALPTAFTPSRVLNIAGGATTGGKSAAPFGARTAATPAFGSASKNARFTPGASQRDALHGAKTVNDTRALGFLGLPADLPPIPSGLLENARPVDLESFLHACEVSFMDAKNLRRKSLAMESLATAPPPSNVTEGLKLVCLTAPMIEALDPLHEHMSEALSQYARDVDKLRADVEAAQPPLVRLAASEDPGHVDALQRAGKALKKECQLDAKDEHTGHRLLTERAVADSLAHARAALERTASSVEHSREVANEALLAADARELSLRERIAKLKDVDAQRSARLSTRRGVLTALAERRAHIRKLESELSSANGTIERLQRRGGEIGAEVARAASRLAEARATEDAETAAAARDDGGASARAAAAERMRAAGGAARRLGEELAVLNRVAPWHLEGLSGAGGCELTLRVGRLFRVNVDVGTGAGRVTLAESSGVSPQGGCAFAAAVAGAPWAWNETSMDACGGDLSAVLQRVTPRLRRAEEILDEAEECRSAFPRITRVRCTAGGDLEMSFTDFTMERKIDVALTMASGAYPRGALRPRVSVAHVGTGPTLPEARVIENAIDRVPAGAVGRRLLGICRLVDWVVARGEGGLGDAAQAAAAAAKPAPAPPAPMPRLGMGRRKGGSGGGVLPAVDNAAALAAAAAEVARLNEAARAAREAVTAAEAVVQPVMEASIASALVVVAGEEKDKENGEAPAAPTTTPAGFEMKGSNPLFEDSIDASMDVDA